MVDGSRESRQELRDILEPLGHSFYEACTGKEAQRALSAEPIDMVIADLAAPGVDGFGFCNTLRSYYSTRWLPVVLIGREEHADLATAAIDAGADDFWVRHAPSGLVRARVQAILRRTPPASAADGDFASVLLSLAQAVEARDPSTGRHCHRVSLLCSRLGMALGLAAEQLITLQRGAFLHDIGKIAVPDHILFKRGPLSAEEWSIMQNHTTCGERICSGMKSLQGVLPIIRSHHERWDGTGYPDRLRADEIPVLARIIQVADIYDALITDRPYKAAYSPERALETLKTEARAGWRDPSIVEAFTEIFPAIKGIDSHSNSSLLALSSVLGKSAQPAAVPVEEK